MKIEFTPGPWKIDRTLGATRHEWLIVYDAGDKGQGMAIARTAPAVGNALENARLISAAPDLLEALELVKAWDIENLSLDIPQEIREKMQTAIDKARGQ